MTTTASVRYSMKIPVWLIDEMNTACALKKISRAELIKDAIKESLTNKHPTNTQQSKD